MARLARVVVPGIPHHVIQRGNRKQQTFFCDDDYRAYLRLLREWADEHGTKILCYCLIPNHSHVIAEPESEESLARTFATCHERYTRMVNKREGWKGYLWQGRFKSYPMDEPYLFNAVRYVLQNPVKAGLAANVFDWPYSSARAHLSGKSDGIVDIGPLKKRISDWKEYLNLPLDTELAAAFEAHASTGRPLGEREFIEELERQTGRKLMPKRSGPRPNPG